MSSARAFLTDMLAKADIQVDGSRPQDITVHDERLFNRVIRYGSLGLGEAYMDGWWDAPSLDAFFTQILSARLQDVVSINLASILAFAKAFFLNLQSSARAFVVGEAHYDLGN